MSNVADGANLLLGKGKLYFERFSASGAAATGALRFLGNVTAFTLTMTDELKQAYSSAESGAPLLKQALIRRTVELGVTMDEFTADNVALALMGTNSDVAAQTGAAVTAQNIRTNMPADGSGLDRSYYVGKMKWDSATPCVVKIDTTTLTVTTDYTFDYLNGMLYVVNNATTLAACAGGAKTLTHAGTTLTYALGLYKSIVGATVGVVEGAFRFIADPSAGPALNVDVWRVDCTPDGDWGLIGEDFGEFKLKGKVVADSAAHPASPLFTVTKMT
jgi:hypothetical protein